MTSTAGGGFARDTARESDDGRPKVVTICGSSRFVDIMAVCSWLIERDEQAITMSLHLLPTWYGEVKDHIAEAEGVAEQMDDLHLRKIDLSDEIFVVNWTDYIGNSTQREVNYAMDRGIPVRWFTLDLIGDKVKDLILNRYSAATPEAE